MVKVLVVNNYPGRERFEKLERCVRENGAEVMAMDWGRVSPTSFHSFDGVVLSGSPAMMSDDRTKERYEPEALAVLDSRVPVLGVCFGHQLMARAFGAEVVKDRRHVLGMVKTTVLKEDSIFDGLPRSVVLLESRHEVVKSLPRGFRLLARSVASRIAAMKHDERPLYGVQFHPERFTKEHSGGSTIVGNFVRSLE